MSEMLQVQTSFPFFFCDTGEQYRLSVFEVRCVCSCDTDFWEYMVLNDFFFFGIKKFNFWNWVHHL
jgi:hypothetical protein